MEIIKAFSLSLGEIEQPIITRYQMGLILHRLYKEKTYKGEQLGKVKKDYAESGDLTRLESQLIANGVLAEVTNVVKAQNIYSLIGRKVASDGDAICSIDPFAYISHLSAMEYHGLTDRIPTKIFISSPSNVNWKEAAQLRMKKDLGEDLPLYSRNGLPELRKPLLKKIGRTDINCFNSKHSGAFVNIKQRSMRVSSIGRTFLDMIRNPELCGGIKHVLDVYEEFSKTYFQLIISEVNDHGSDIDKVRVGYILDEKLGLTHETIQSWEKFAQRGGSRKLDASAEYHNQFSEKWCLSLNVF